MKWMCKNVEDTNSKCWILSSNAHLHTCHKESVSNYMRNEKNLCCSEYIRIPIKQPVSWKVRVFSWLVCIYTCYTYPTTFPHGMSRRAGWNAEILFVQCAVSERKFLTRDGWWSPLPIYNVCIAITICTYVLYLYISICIVDEIICMLYIWYIMYTLSCMIFNIYQTTSIVNWCIGRFQMIMTGIPQNGLLCWYRVALSALKRCKITAWKPL